MAFGWRVRGGDGTAFKCLISLAAVYGVIALGVYAILHMWHVKPLALDAPLDRFSEARAIEHVRKLTVDIDGRQEGKPGLEAAAKYIEVQLEMIAARAGPDYRIEIEETLVSGSFSMIFLRHSISLGYRNHKNVAMRISSRNSTDDDPSVMVNGHFDSPPGSPGAGDCGSCVASMLETARQIVDSGWVPPRPIIFLFNGAEEVFLLGSHGFMKTNKWRDTIGAFINIEASGSGGPDLVCQSGPGSWPSNIYAQSAIYPMATSAAQDIFGIIPGDTDYRIFAKDNGDIPGLDIIFVLGGYFYHTSYDTIERLFPGSIQARGENLFNLIEAFANSPLLQNAKQRSNMAAKKGAESELAVYSDYLSLFMIYYSRRVSLVLHTLPVLIFFLMPLVLGLPNVALHQCTAIFTDMLKGLLFHVIGVLLAVIVPVVFAVLRLFFSNYSMSWFAHPYLAFLMFIPSSLIGLLIPKTICGFFPTSQDTSMRKMPKEALSEEAHFWGAFGFYSFTTMAYLLAGLGGGCLTYLISVSMALAWCSFFLVRKHSGYQSLKSLTGYVVPLIPCLTYLTYFGGFLVQFLIEKMGMMGSLPQPYGYFIPDVIVAATVGVVTGWCVGPLMPIAGRWLARSSILQFLLQFSVIALALSSQFFPYSDAAPKRVVLQHRFVTAGGHKIVESSYDFSVLDSNSLSFVFKYAPEAAKILNIGADFPFEAANRSDRSSWVAIFPVSSLFSGSLKFPAQGDDNLKHYTDMPHLSMQKPISVSKAGARRVHLELSLGSLKEVWVTVLNITGPLSAWSFADGSIPDPHMVVGGPPSYILRLSGSSHENWIFWIEANSSEALRVDLAVVDQHLVDDTEKLKTIFPRWIDVTAFSSFLTTYYF
ncbi:putative peptidase M28 [Dioscorea sansibarensis]